MVKGIFVAIALTAMIALANAAGAPKSNSQAAFEELSSLVGQWEGKVDGTEVTLIYTLSAEGTVLMEENVPAKGPKMITMFTVDGDHLMATHYCPAGNQPQMMTGPITQPDNETLQFSLVRVTGLKSPNDFHNTGIKVTFEDHDHLTQEWSYLYKGKSGSNIFHFTRKQS